MTAVSRLLCFLGRHDWHAMKWSTSELDCRKCPRCKRFQIYAFYKFVNRDIWQIDPIHLRYAA